VALDRSSRFSDPFAAAARLIDAAGKAPLPPVVFLSGDDEWFVREGARRISAAFMAAFPEGEVTTYDGPRGAAAEAVSDVSTVALFSTNRLVVLEASDLLRGKKLSAEDVDSLLDDAAEAGGDKKALARLGRRARLLAVTAGAGSETDPHEAARKVTGRVRRQGRADELAALLELAPPEPEDQSGGDVLLEYLAAAHPGDNSLLVLAVSPDADHPATQALSRKALSGDLAASGDNARQARLAALGFERAMERNVAVDGEVYELLCSRGRLSARAFLGELDRLVAGAKGARVRAEDAARLVSDEKKEYGSDFVDAAVKRQFVPALRLLDRLMTSDDFTAFRPFGKEEAPARKGPKGEAAFFPLLGLLAGEFRRVLAMKAVLAQLPAGSRPARRLDYRSFADRFLPALKSPPPGAPPIPLEGHPFVLHKAYLASYDWSLGELVEAMKGIAAIDEGVKSGTGDGRELLETFLLSRAAPAKAAGRDDSRR
jgi:DNA polymerase III delta subunit